MTATGFRAQQPPLPQGPAIPEDATPEGVKLEWTAKGPRWSIRVHAGTSSDDHAMIERLAYIDRLMREKFGEPT